MIAIFACCRQLYNSKKMEGPGNGCFPKPGFVQKLKSLELPKIDSLLMKKITRKDTLTRGFGDFMTEMVKNKNFLLIWGC